jgi:hypothetical protein
MPTSPKEGKQAPGVGTFSPLRISKGVGYSVGRKAEAVDRFQPTASTPTLLLIHQGNDFVALI